MCAETRPIILKKSKRIVKLPNERNVSNKSSKQDQNNLLLLDQEGEREGEGGEGEGDQGSVIEPAPEANPEDDAADQAAAVAAAEKKNTKEGEEEESLANDEPVIRDVN